MKTRPIPVDKLVDNQLKQSLQWYISMDWKSRLSNGKAFLFFLSNQFVMIALRRFAEALPKIEPRVCPGFLPPVHISPVTTIA